MIPRVKFHASLTLVVLLGSMITAIAQDMDSSMVRKKVEDKHYTFVAQTANPMRGNVIQLTTAYDLRIAGDSVIAALPYFGRAYSAPINAADNGIRFSSVQADYRPVYRKKRWEIRIRPKDVQNVNELNLTIYSNGRATLQVSSNNRQPISFNGFIAERK